MRTTTSTLVTVTSGQGAELTLEALADQESELKARIRHLRQELHNAERQLMEVSK